MSEINKITKVDHSKTQNVSQNKKGVENTSFNSFLGETRTLDSIFREAADKYNVSVELLKSIGKAESSFNPKAVSRCGAQGVMQLMPATAKSLGVTDSFDAEQNIMGGAKYIAGLIDKYDGNTKLALAAYNAGSGNVAKYHGIPPFEETQNYVKKVMAYMKEGTDTQGAVVSTGGAEAGGESTASAGLVTTPAAPVQNNYAFLIANSMMDSSDDLKTLDALFSYDDYLQFVDQFLKNLDEQEKDKEKEEQQNSNYNNQDITYNVPVMKLLKNQKLI